MADYEEMRAKLGRKLVDQYEEAEGFLREGSETEKAVDLLESALKETSESFPESIKASASYAELLLSYGKALLQTLREQETEDALLGPEVLKSELCSTDSTSSLFIPGLARDALSPQSSQQ
uniref:Uncharacterized protein n=1 Tax=Rhodosorus marinus TaxID=101924 RepID=A0A7S3EIL1_9RHOD|mmetsp:Transcript_35576/g.141927  ORF Transcript_35576/g.141927 Transcript_35576/m.141927 type:complete len:121 (+) Transcript_35576:175-537(+)